MSKIICGHFNFIIRDCWLFCQSCKMGININSAKGQRLLATKSEKVKLTKQQQEVQYIPLAEKRCWHENRAA